MLREKRSLFGEVSKLIPKVKTATIFGNSRRFNSNNVDISESCYNNYLDTMTLNAGLGSRGMT